MRCQVNNSEYFSAGMGLIPVCVCVCVNQGMGLIELTVLCVCVCVWWEQESTHSSPSSETPQRIIALPITRHRIDWLLFSLQVKLSQTRRRADTPDFYKKPMSSYESL